MRAQRSPDQTGTRLRAARLGALMTLEELAERSGVSVRAISDLEHGRTGRPHPRTVRLLADALGLPPSAAGLFVAGDGARDGSAAAVAESGGAPQMVAPAQLPATARYFTGRVPELEMLSRWLDDLESGAGSVLIAAICGAAGVGKTALAVHWARANAARFPDGQLFVDLRGFGPGGAPLTPAEAIRGFLSALQFPPRAIPPDAGAQLSLYRSLLAGRRILMVLDNAGDDAQVRSLLPTGLGSIVLVTSRRLLAGLAAMEGANLLSLDVLTDSEARETLTMRLGARAAAEPQAVTELIALSARLPLALGIIAARAVTRPRWSLASLVAELRTVSDRLDALEAGEVTASVRTALSWSAGRLSAGATRMLALLGLHAGPDITVAAAASLAGVARWQARAAMDELLGLHLIAEPLPGRFAFHDLLRAYAAEHAARLPSDVVQSSVRRVLDHYLHSATTAAMLLYQIDPPNRPMPAVAGVTAEDPPDRRQAYGWLEAERPVMLAAIRQAQHLALDTHAIGLAAALREFQIRRAYWHELADTQRIALSAACHSGDQAAEATCRRYLGSVLREFGQFDIACAQLKLSLAIHQLLDDPQGQCRCLFELARVSYEQANYSEALAHASDALRLARAAGHLADEAHTLSAVGAIHAKLGNCRLAQAYCDRALIMHRRAHNKLGEALTLQTLSNLRISAGHSRAAVTLLLQAIDACQETGDRFELAGMHDALGAAHHASGNLTAARSAWQQALTAFNELQHPKAREAVPKLALAIHAGPRQTAEPGWENAPDLER